MRLFKRRPTAELALTDHNQKMDLFSRRSRGDCQPAIAFSCSQLVEGMRCRIGENDPRPNERTVTRWMLMAHIALSFLVLRCVGSVCEGRTSPVRRTRVVGTKIRRLFSDNCTSVTSSINGSINRSLTPKIYQSVSRTRAFHVMRWQSNPSKHMSCRRLCYHQTSVMAEPSKISRQANCGRPSSFCLLSFCL